MENESKAKSGDELHAADPGECLKTTRIYAAVFMANRSSDP
jgi:hypothetical protein